MNQRIPKAEWAIEKVRVYLPASKEKSTLMAIAGYINHVTGTCKVRRSLIAHDSGHSERTVQRHMAQLEQDGHLVIDRPSRYEHRASVYRIPCCSLSIEELEFITGTDGNQLLLGIVTPDQPGTTVVVADTWKTLAERQWESDCLSMGDKLSPDGRQTVSPNIPEHVSNRDPAQILLENGERVLLKKTKKANIREANEDYSRKPTPPMSPETRQLLDQAMLKLVVTDRDAPVGIGSRLRASLYGNGVAQPERSPAGSSSGVDQDEIDA